MTAFAVNAETPLSQALCFYETPSSGGKANAIEIAPFRGTGDGTAQQGGAEWIVLTDDDEGLAAILEWDATSRQLSEIARVAVPGGTSHAIWLS